MARPARRESAAHELGSSRRPLPPGTQCVCQPVPEEHLGVARRRELWVLTAQALELAAQRITILCRRLVAGVSTDTDQAVGDGHGIMTGCQSDPQIPIGQLEKAGIEPPDRAQHVKARYDVGGAAGNDIAPS